MHLRLCLRKPLRTKTLRVILKKLSSRRLNNQIKRAKTLTTLTKKKSKTRKKLNSRLGMMKRVNWRKNTIKLESHSQPCMFFHVIVTTECNLKCRYCFGESLDDFDESFGDDLEV